MFEIVNRRMPLVAVSGVLVFLAGCSSKPAPTLSAEVSKPAATEAPETVVKVNEPPAPVVLPTADALPKSVDELNRRGYLKDVFFDFDAYAVRSDQRNVLGRDADWLKKAATVKILVEGHCDERGTASYNMALGERRAESVREYLETLGIAPARIQIVSYGKEKPFALGHDEADWAQNRRDHVVVTAD